MGIDESPLGDLPKGWTLARLADIARPIGSGATPRGGSAVYLSYREGFALVRSQNVFDRRFDNDGLAFISDAAADELSGASLEADDLLLNITGDGVTFGRACMVPRGVLPACVNQHVVRIRCDRKKCEPAYLLSYLTHPMVKHYIEGFNAGGSRRAITKGHIESFIVPLSPLPEQRAIARVLGALDDKIELNRRMNRTLEDLARGLFRSWFVDFDPVLRPARARPHTPPDAAAAPTPPHFPTRLVDSPLGPIPEGWRVGTVGELCEWIVSGGTPSRQKAEYWDNATVRWFKTGELTDGPLLEAEERISEQGLADSACRLWQPGTVLFALYASPTLGRMGVLEEPGTSNQACAALWVKPEYGLGFLVQTLFLAREQLQRISSGAAQQNINQGILRSHAVIFPPPAVAAEFSRIVHPWYREQVRLARESRQLAALRDALLPQLLSGEIRLREAERAVGDSLRSTSPPPRAGGSASPRGGMAAGGVKGRA